MTCRNGISISDLSGKSALLTRATADEVLAGPKPSQFAPGSQIVIDFTTVKGVSPSFISRLIGGLRLKYSAPSSRLSLCFLRMPTPASEKYFAVGRSHDMFLDEASAGEWHFTESRG